MGRVKIKLRKFEAGYVHSGVGKKTYPPSSFLSKLLGLIAEELSSNYAQLILLDEEGGFLLDCVWPHHKADPSLLCREITLRALDERRPLLEDDCETEGEKERRLHILCFPFLLGSHPQGALCLLRTPASKPYDSGDLVSLARLAGLFGFLGDHRSTPPEEDEGNSSSGSPFIIGPGRSTQFIEIMIEKIKDADSPVFIFGESGTGKELIARAIHERGRRRRGPFVAVNCGAIPDYLLESELFGYARGAFTGASRDKAGLIEEASGGTFFLDEIGDLSLPLQAKLLRLLQEKEMRRVGENRTRRVNVRFISATNKDIEEEITRGNFRKDLYYRLRILAIEVPPLRERNEDLLLLLNHFTEKYCQEMNRERAFFSPRAVELLMNYSWPGNVRELQSEVQKCLILSGGESLITEDHLSPKINPTKELSPSAPFNFFDAKADFEKRFLKQALLRFDFHKARTAREIGLSRQGLFKLMKKHRIEASSTKREYWIE